MINSGKVGYVESLVKRIREGEHDLLWGLLEYATLEDLLEKGWVTTEEFARWESEANKRVEHLKVW